MKWFYMYDIGIGLKLELSNILLLYHLLKSFLDKYSAELPTLPDSAEDFLIVRENKPIRVHKFDNLPDSGNILSIEL